MAHGLKHNEGSKILFAGACLRPAEGGRRGGVEQGGGGPRNPGGVAMYQRADARSSALLGVAFQKSYACVRRCRHCAATCSLQCFPSPARAASSTWLVCGGCVAVTRCPPRRCGRLDAAEGRAFGTRRRCLAAARALSRASGRRGTGHRHSHPCWGAGAESTARRTARPT